MRAIKMAGVLVLGALTIGFVYHVEPVEAKIISAILGSILIGLFLYEPKPKN